MKITDVEVIHFRTVSRSRGAATRWGYGEWLEKLDKSCKQHKLLKWGKGSLPKDLPGVVKLTVCQGRVSWLSD